MARSLSSHSAPILLGAVVAVLGMVLVGCDLTRWTAEIREPKANLRPLGELGYQSEADRHLFYRGVVEPELVEHWKAGALPFGEIRFSKWCMEECFESWVWFPGGLPAVKGERCGLQQYRGVKIEGNLTREIHGNGYHEWVLEYHPSEQRAFRWKCDLDPTAPGYPKWDNMAGY